MWKTIEGYPDYLISDQGRVKSLKCGKIKLLKLSERGDGYLGVALYGKGGDRGLFSIHRLVMAIFIGSCPEGKECNHRNGNKTDNRVENLEWITPSENHLHAYRTGLKVAHGETGKTIQQFTASGIFLRTHKSMAEASRRTGANVGCISRCCRGAYGAKTAGGFIWRPA